MPHDFNSFGTPAYPAPPHPSPSSHLKQRPALFKPKLPRPPVHNPFDKFSQNDFDVWIGRLTGDLQKALGYEEVEQPRPASPSSSVAGDRAGQSARTEEEDYLEADSYVEDSFAEVKARRVLDKGKARDPREGPGLGPKYGGKEQPIEILSDEEEEEVEEEDEVMEFEDSDAEEREVEYEGEAEEDQEDEDEAEPSIRPRVQNRRRIETGLVEEEMEEIGLVRQSSEDHGQDGEGEEYEEEEGDRQSSDEVIELLSDEDEAGPSAAKQQREEEEEFLSDEAAADARSSPAEDDEDGGIEALEEGDEQDGQRDEDMQPSDEDTSFPPHSSARQEPSNIFVNIRAPWTQVEKYAEDYYAGGEVVPNSNRRLTADHLGANDDGSSFLTPDVANAELEKEEQGGEQEEEEDEFEEMEDFEEKESALDDFDENDHLFNRLRAQMISDLRSHRPHVPVNVRMTGHGTNDEPIMIESDDEAEVDFTQEHETDEEDEEDEIVDEMPEERLLVKVEVEEITIEKTVEEPPEAQTHTGRIYEEITRVKETELQAEEARLKHHTTGKPVRGEAQPTASTTVFKPTSITEYPLLESRIPHLPVPPAQHTQLLDKAENKASEATDATIDLYDNIQDVVPASDSQSAGKGNHVIAAEDLVWSGSAFQGQARLHGHKPTNAPGSSFQRLDVPSTIPGFRRAEDNRVSTMNIDAEVFGFGDVTTEFEYESRHSENEEMRTGVRVGSMPIEEVVDEEEDELDELDEPGAFPLMTSDLEYPPEEELLEEANMRELERESTPKQVVELVVAGGPATPSKAIGAEDEVVDSEEVQIFVETPEDFYAGTPPEEISINIEAATPMLGMEAQFEETPASPLTETQVELIEDVSEAIPTPQGKASSEPIVIDEDEVPTELSTQETVTASTVPEFADVTITIEDATHPTKEHISFTEQEEQFTYSIEEPLTDSEYRASEGLERGVSIGIASVHSDEVMPPTIVKGDVEEVISDTEPDQEQEAPISHDDGAATVVPQTVAEIVEESDVKNTQLSDQGVDEMTETVEEILVEPALANPPPLLTPPPGTNHEDYFAQPGSPIIEAIPMKLDVPSQANLPMTPNGSLPSIIQLPGTPQKVLSPVSTPGPGPTPVSIAVEPAVLKALRTNRDFVKVLTSPPLIPAPQQRQQSSTTDVAPPTAAENNSDTTAVAPQQQATTELLQLPKVSAPVYSPSEPGDQSPTNGVPTFHPVITTLTRQPTLFEDPYPYSLSTPGPPNEETEEGSEEDTEQDNSMSTSSSANSAGKESDGPIFENAVNVELGYPPAEPTMATETKVDEIVENALEVGKSLVDIEAEADALIDEFLVDEPESDTDADGEADPEFVDLESSDSARASEECVAKQVEEAEVESSGVMEVQEAKEVSMKEAEAVPEARGGGRRSEDDEKDQALPSKETDGETLVTRKEEEEQDAFKLMGNDSTVAPGEILDKTLSEEKSSSEEKSEGEAGTIESAPLALEPKETSATVPSTTPYVDVAPVKRLHPPTVPSHGMGTPSVGVVPYHVAAAAYHESSRPNVRAAPDLLPFGQVTAPIYSLQQKEQQEVSRVTQALEHTNSTTQKSPLAKTSRNVEQQETVTPTPTPGSKVEELPRKVRVSVEDPYNADNDSDREHGSNTSRNGKRKRSLSDVSGSELPSIASKSSKGKGKATSSRTAAKVSRPRKEGSKKSISRNVFGGPLTSRSPSVASSVLSEPSSAIQPSPTHPTLASSEPRPFLHAHSRRKRGSVPTAVQEPLHKQLHKSASGSRSQSGILKAEDVLTKAPSISSTSSNSPVTRSHCRYHQITIPKTENGPRINFLVPGCSLNDEDLIDEEEIVDLGEAIVAGDTRIVDNIETLDFDPYLLWVMRQLVGTEILRENEVFYLPEADEEIVRVPPKAEAKKGSKTSKKPPKVPHEKIATSPRESAGHSPSRGSSVASSSVSVLRQVLGGSDIDELSTVTETDDDTPLLRPEGKAARVETNNGTNGSPLKNEASALSRKRGRRLGQDAAAYHPSTEEGSSEHSDHNPNHKSNRNRGVKRPRASEANMTEGTDSRKLKKPKTQLSQTQSRISSEQDQPQTQANQNQPRLNPSQPSIHAETVPRIAEGTSNAV